jgi:glycosyltransferase involved in cell wall biosynthesis
VNILHFSTSDFTGGAAKAAYRLHTALRAAGHTSRMIVRDKQSGDPDVEAVATIKKLIRPLWRREKLPAVSYTFNLDAELDVDTRPFFRHPPGTVDVICLHWITKLLTVETISQLAAHYSCPIVWVPVDQEPVTGGCHYSFGCDGFTRQCGNCPLLTPRGPEDRSRVVWRRKQNHLSNLPLTFVAATSWVAARVKESSLFRNCRIEFIPLAIDPAVFRPFEQRIARDLLNLPPDKKVLFFGAYSLADRRKGIQLLVAALQKLAALARQDHSQLAEEVFLLVVGRLDADFRSALPFPHQHVRFFNDDVSLALAYQAADVFVCPSVEDAGPMMIPEAMLCGTPTVAFNTGGAPDLITTMQTGYLAAHQDAADLANGIFRLLTADNLAAIRHAAREAAVAKHAPAIVAAQHVALYASLTSGRRN